MTNNIIIISPYQINHENPKNGADKLILMQEQHLKNLGYSVHLISLTNLRGVIPFLLNLASFSKQKKDSNNISTINLSSNQNFFWFLNLIFMISLYYIQKFDILFKYSLKTEINNIGDRCIIFNNYGIVFPKNIPSSCILNMFEFNVEYDLYRQLIGNRLIYRPFLSLYRQIEIHLIELHKNVFCLTKDDYNILIKDTRQDNIFIWVPLPNITSKNNAKIIKLRSQDKFIIGFLGTSFYPNIEAAKSIIALASKIHDEKIEFLIIGTVGYALDKSTVPKNVTLTGWVNNLNDYLSNCDIFLNPKVSIEGGLEIKVYDYLKYLKPIISTSNGARGYPLSNTNSIINDDVTQWDKHIITLLNNIELRNNLEIQLDIDIKNFIKNQDTFLINILN
jgi:glycosyltransferase involved in cell wall biosynthesis